MKARNPSFVWKHTHTHTHKTEKQMELNTSFTWSVKTKLFFISYFLFMLINIRWDKFLLERSESKESFFCLKKKTTKEQMELNTSFAWLIETKLFFFFFFFFFIIILLNSKHGDYLKPFNSNLFHFNLIFSFLSKLTNKFKRRKEKKKIMVGSWVCE